MISLRLAEDQAGEYDLVFTPRNSQVFNYTALNLSLADVGTLVGVAPRWLFPAQLSSLTDPSIVISVTVLVIDTNLENVRLKSCVSFFRLNPMARCFRI